MGEPSDPGTALVQEVPSSAEPAPPPDAPPSLAESLRHAPLTFVLAAINVAVLLWAERSGSTTTAATLLQFGAVERIHVWAGEPWRLVTCMFLHIGWIHLVWNTYASIGWCVGAEREIGSWRFLFVYLVSGVGAACASVIFQDRVSAGASGAMFGVVGLALVLRRRTLESWDAFFSDRGVRSTLINIGVWTVLGLTALPMDNYAHGGGFVVGAVAAWILTDRRATRSAWLGFAAGFSVLIVAALRPWWRPSDEDAERMTALCRAGVPKACSTLDLLRSERVPRSGN